MTNFNQETNLKIYSQSKKINGANAFLQIFALFNFLLTFLSISFFGQVSLLFHFLTLFIVYIFFKGLIQNISTFRSRPFLIEGTIERLKHSRSLGVPNSTKEITLALKNVFEVFSSGEHKEIGLGKKTFNTTSRIVEVWQEGVEDVFVVSGKKGLLYAKYSEIGKLDDKKLELNFNSLIPNFLILLIWFLGIVGYFFYSPN